ncbi:MAG: hypothetical protein J6P70_04985 [Ruminobacter sp.]|nr:hypothetical protein [Ruminobacter sp.]
MMKVQWNTAVKSLLCILVMSVSHAAAADVITIDGKDYAYAAGFEVDENTESDGAGRNIIGRFTGHQVYVNQIPGYSLRPTLAYLQEGNELSPEKEGILLTTTFVLRCVDFNRECVGEDLKALADVNSVNDTYKLRTLEVKNLDNWHKVYDYYLEHRDEFAKFYPVLDRGKALHNRDIGLFGGNNARTLFTGPATDEKQNGR